MNSTRRAALAAGGSAESHRVGVVLRVVRAPIERRTYRELLFLLSAAPLAAAWFGLLLAGWLAVLLLAVTPLVVPALLGFRGATRIAAAAEAALARTLLGTAVRVPPARRASGYWGSVRAVLADASFWAQQTYLLLRMLVGGALAVGVASFAAAALALLTLPVWYRWTSSDVFGSRVDTLGEALVYLPAGLAGVLLTPHLARGLAGAWRPVARGLLGAEPGAPGRAAGTALRRGLPYHAAAYAGLNVLLVVVWAATSRGYFWPEWTLLSLGLPLAVHAWAALVLSGRIAVAPRMRPLTVHAGAAAALVLFLVGVWGVTTRGYFWPAWAALGLAVALGLHALAAATRRIEVLTASRAGAVDVADDELRRIERDLHDGAQARLVAVGINLGLAEQRFAADPEGARQLLAEARTGTTEALRELRDLARGIHPPVLADRGLQAALESLVGGHPLPVALSVAPGPRPPEPVETAAYFVAAEALTNAAKHAGAGRVEIRVERRGEALVVSVRDDGRGGADETGAGLAGIRRRVEALDGTLTVSSPPGGPTLVEAVVPCGR